MAMKQAFDLRKWLTVLGIAATGMVGGCGGGSTGTQRDSSSERTTLSVAATDADGDVLSYQWRVTAGSVENRNARETVWTLPSGPGLHFAYVMVSDGRGGYAEQQYAVSTDPLRTEVPARAAVAYPIATGAPSFDGTALRVRLRQAGAMRFGDPDSGPERQIYLPDVTVRVTGNGVQFTGITDLNGELNLPQLAPLGAGLSYTTECASSAGAAFAPCGNPDIAIDPARSSVQPKTLVASASNNLRVHGHVSMADDHVCGTQNEFFNVQSSATVQLLQSNGQPIGAAVRVNRFGDYALDAPVGVNDRLTLHIECGSDKKDIALTPDTDADLRNRLINSLPFERSHRFENNKPSITRMLANGPDGNVRGRMVVEEIPAVSNNLPGGVRFLSYKGTDSALSACMYYRSIGAVSGCDPQGRMQGAISFDDWKKAHSFGPYNAGNTEVAATYVNERDLNLVRRMVATQTASNSIAFYVCNNPGPEGRSQVEIDQVIGFGVAAERRVACVAMEHSPSPGVNGGQPFTKFLTFGPDGSLIASVNLDQRGEKYMPGACVACHGGSKIGARFPESGNPSPLLGARFLPFDTGNYLFSTHPDFTEAKQAQAFRQLNDLVVATEGGFAADTPTTRLVSGWYQKSPTDLDKAFVPPVAGWTATADKAAFYQSVIGRSCRTCHTALGPSFDWDSQPARFDSLDSGVRAHVCGATADLATNASMPNALASLNRLLDPSSPGVDVLKERMVRYLGCSAPAEDPAFARR